MSKAVRIREHLHAEIERLARENRRTLIDQLELLLEQALRIEEGATVTGERRTAVSDTGGAAPSPGDQAAPTGKEQEARVTTPFRPGDDALRPPPSNDEVEPDFKPERKK